MLLKKCSPRAALVKQRWIRFQATLLFVMASVAAIICSVMHSSEVLEPFAIFLKRVLVCV